MKLIIASFWGCYECRNWDHKIHRIDILADSTVAFQSVDCDGETRHYNWPIYEFENEFNINIGELLSENGITLPNS